METTAADQIRGRVFVENHDVVDATQSQQHADPVMFAVHGSIVALQVADAGVGIQPDDEQVAALPGPRQILDMPGVQQIKTPVRKHNSLALPACFGDDCLDFIKSLLFLN